MEKSYSPGDIEEKHYTRWEEQGYFKPQGEGPTFSIMIPPPNVTGELHMGHALNHTLQDAIVRHKRMQGYKTLWLPGLDHAGIATQSVVERKLAEEGISRHDLGREQFVEKVWEWKNEYGNRIKGQIKRLGDSVDWSRERFTMDPEFQAAVRHHFVKLYHDGHIYRGKRIINWSPALQTALSDIEVEHEERQGHLWHIRYDAEDGTQITIATTRPETLFGDTAVAVHPEDDRYKQLIGKTVTIPVANRQIPIIADDYVDPNFGSGAVKITPAHDPNDFHVGQRHDLEQLLIMDTTAHLNENVPEAYQGLERYEARKKLIAELEAGGHLVKTEEYTHSVGLCYRSKVPIEPYLSDQWFIKMEPLTKPALDAVHNNDIELIPSRWGKLYDQWMENIQDWCISRQLWWGHRVPAWYHKVTGDIYVSETPPENEDDYTQDEDVLDTWFSSAIWPFATLGWPEDTQDLAAYHPNAFLVTGYDILTFWVSRMITMGIYQTNQVPFPQVYVHGLVRDITGKKMSKSIGNVINPLELIDEFGADALRFCLASLSTLGGQDIRFSTERVQSARNFATKLWNASRYIMMIIDEHNGELNLDPSTFANTLENQWILSHYATTINTVNAAFKQYNYAQAANTLWEFTWNILCDWYIEMSKLNKADNLPVLVYLLVNTLKLLHPLMPFITEELWQLLRATGKVSLDHESIVCAQWPDTHPQWIDASIIQRMDAVIESIRAVRNLRAERNIAPSKQLDVVLVSQDANTRDALTEGESFIKKLARVDTLSISGSQADKPAQALSTVAGHIEVFVSMSGIINIDDEKQRLNKRLAQIEKDLTQYEGKLGNTSFIEKAPEHVVSSMKEKRDAADAEKQLLATQIAQLNG